MGRYLVRGDGCTLSSGQPRCGQDFLHYRGLGLAIVIDGGRAGTSFPLHSGVLSTQRRIGAKHITDRQVITQRQAVGHDHVGVGTRQPGWFLKRPALGDAKLTLRSKSQCHQDRGRRGHVGVGDHDVTVDDGLGCQARNRRAPDMLDRRDRDPSRRHGCRILVTQSSEALRPGTVILHDNDHQPTIWGRRTADRAGDIASSRDKRGMTAAYNFMSTALIQVTDHTLIARVMICKTVGFYRGGAAPHLWPSLGDGEKVTVISSPGRAQPYAGASGVDAKVFPDGDDASGLAADHAAWFPGPGRRWQETA